MISFRKVWSFCFGFRGVRIFGSPRICVIPKILKTQNQRLVWNIHKSMDLVQSVLEVWESETWRVLGIFGLQG